MHHDNDNEPLTDGERIKRRSFVGSKRGLTGLLLFVSVAVSLLGLPGLNSLLHAFDGVGADGPASTANFVYFILVYGAAMIVVGTMSMGRFRCGALITSLATFIGLSGATGYFMSGFTANAVFLGVFAFSPVAITLYLWRMKARLKQA